MNAVRCSRAAVLGGALLLLAAHTLAYRPFDGTHADAAPLHVFELELGPVHYYRPPGRTFLIAPALVLNLGILQNTELVVDAQNYVALGAPPPSAGRLSLRGDDVLVKHVFREGVLQGKSGPSVAVEAGVLTPELGGDTGVGGSCDVIGSYAWVWGAIHWNEWLQLTRRHHADLFSGVILEGPSGWVVRPVAELFFDKDFEAGHAGSLLLGAIWTASDALAFDVGARAARVDGGDAFEARAGLTWAISLAPNPAE